MLKTSGALLVLLCCCLAETQLSGETISENDITHQGQYSEAESRENEVMGAVEGTGDAETAAIQQTCQADIHSVLREMTALVTRLEGELGFTKTQMDAVEARLRASENKAETLETRLRASERRVEQLQSISEGQVEILNVTVNHVTNLRRERKDRRVSFSAAMLSSGSTTYGPYNTAKTLAYQHVFTNIGNAYNRHTGMFTAPVRGVYHFYFVLHGHGHASLPNVVFLRKNSENVVVAWEHQASNSVNPSNGASLLLEVGDVVYLQLKDNARVFDSQNRHTTFSGHLLFTI